MRPLIGRATPSQPAETRGAAEAPHRHRHHRLGRVNHRRFQAQGNHQRSHLQPDRRSLHRATLQTMCLVVELHKNAKDFGSQKTYYQQLTPRSCVLARTQTFLSHAKEFVSLQEDSQLTQQFVSSIFGALVPCADSQDTNLCDFQSHIV